VEPRRTAPPKRIEAHRNTPESVFDGSEATSSDLWSPRCCPIAHRPWHAAVGTNSYGVAGFLWNPLHCSGILCEQDSSFSASASSAFRARTRHARCPSQRVPAVRPRTRFTHRDAPAGVARYNPRRVDRRAVPCEHSVRRATREVATEGFADHATFRAAHGASGLAVAPVDDSTRGAPVSRRAPRRS